MLRVKVDSSTQTNQLQRLNQSSDFQLGSRREGTITPV